MKCLSCGDNVCWVITKNTAICDKCGAEHTQEGLFWNCCLLETRAEKAESELKAIKDRIEAVTEEDMGNTDLDVFIKYIIGGVK